MSNKTVAKLLISLAFVIDIAAISIAYHGWAFNNDMTYMGIGLTYISFIPIGLGLCLLKDE